MEKLKNGVIIKPLLKKTWISGKKFGSHISGIAYEIINSSGDWKKYRPSDEKQKQRGNETNGCTGFGLANDIEEQVNRLLKLEIIELDDIWLDSNGLFDLSDSGLNKMSGTDPNRGNSMQNPLETVRTQGVMPQKIRPNDFSSVANYYKPITLDEEKWAKKFLDMFTFQYEAIPPNWVFGRGSVSTEKMKTHLKQCPIYVAAQIGGNWGGGVINFPSSHPYWHAFMIENIDQWKEIMDSYNPFGKKLNLNYPIPYAFKVIVKPKPLILKKKSMVKIVKEENGKGYAFLLPANNPGTLMGMAKTFGLRVPGEMPDKPEWSDLDDAIQGTYKLN